MWKKWPGRGMISTSEGKLRVGHVGGVALLGHEKFVPQIGGRIAAVKERGLQNGVFREGLLDARGEHLAAGLLLQIAAAAYVVGVGVGHQYAPQLPAVGVQYLTHLPPGVLVAAAVDEIYAVPPGTYMPILAGQFT
jgi:hypothetical protein